MEEAKININGKPIRQAKSNSEGQMEVELSWNKNVVKKKKKIIIFDRRFKVVRKLAKGSFGQCFEAVDILENFKKVICKINDEQPMNELEGNVLKHLNDKGYKNFPKLLSIGVKYKRPYQILERFGQTLEFY